MTEHSTSLWPDYQPDIALSKNLAAHVNRLWAAERDIKALLIKYAEAIGLRDYDVRPVVDLEASRVGLVRTEGDRKAVMLVWLNGRAQTNVEGTLTDTPMTALESPDVFAMWCLEATSKAACAKREARERKDALLAQVREVFGKDAAEYLFRLPT